MKNSIILVSLFIFISSCNTEKVKWEFTSTPSVKERGSFTGPGVNIHRTLSKADINSKLGLESTKELQTIKILSASASIDVDLNTTTADSLEFELHCDAIPLETTHKGTFKIPKGSASGNLLGQKVKLLGVSFTVTELLNGILQGLVTSGKSTGFSLVGRTKPSGTTVNCDVLLYIDFQVVYWECVEKPEITIFDNRNKGLCN